MENLSVGQVAKRCGVKVSTLHFYERQQLIFSSRNNGNQRRYGRDTLRRVSLIKAAQKMGISLQEIQAAFVDLPQFSAPDNEAWQQLAIKWQGQLDQRIESLTRLRNLLTGCIGCGCLSLKSCPLYNPEDTLSEKGPGPVILDKRHE